MKKNYEKLHLGIVEDVDVITTSGEGDDEWTDGDTMPDWDITAIDGMYNV